LLPRPAASVVPTRVRAVQRVLASSVRRRSGVMNCHDRNPVRAEQGRFVRSRNPVIQLNVLVSVVG
jgi:hypothetical protein